MVELIGLDAERAIHKHRWIRFRNILLRSWPLLVCTCLYPVDDLFTTYPTSVRLWDDHGQHRSGADLVMPERNFIEWKALCIAGRGNSSNEEVN